MALLAAMDEAVKEVEASRQLQEEQPGSTPVALLSTPPANGSGNTTISEAGNLGQVFIQGGQQHDVSDDEDDGEIEYGEGFAPADSGHDRKLPSQPQAKPPSPPPADFGPPVLPPPAPMSSSSSTASQAHGGRGDDAFGISYKSMHSKKSKEPSTTTMKGPGFQDEEEFENDLVTTSSAVFSLATTGNTTSAKAGGSNDDDFEDDGFAAPSVASTATTAVPVPHHPTVNVAEVMTRARQQYMPSASTVPAAPIDPILSFVDSNMDHPVSAVGAEGGGGGELAEQTTDLSKPSIWTEAQAALEEISDTYAKGFGDVEVRAMGSSSGHGQNAVAGVGVAAVGGGTGVIEEEDEEMYAQAEEEAEKAAMEAALEAKRREEELRQEWQSLTVIAEPAKGGGGSEEAGGSSQEASSLTEIGYDEACEALGAKYIDKKPQSKIASSTGSRSGGGGRGVKGLFGGLLHKSPPRLDPTLEAEKNLILCLSEEPYTPTDPIHLRAIRRLWHTLTGQHNCPITGSHWEEIGFQGADPSTDLNRSMGIWSILQALYFLEAQPVLCQETMQASRDSAAHWPFMLVSIGFTRQALEAVRDGRINHCALAHGSVAEASHMCHQALFYEFLQRVRLQPSVHHATHLGALRAVSAGKGLLALEARYTQALQSKEELQKSLSKKNQSLPQSSSAPSLSIRGGKEAVFTDLASVQDEETVAADEEKLRMLMLPTAVTPPRTATKTSVPKAAKPYLTK